MAIQYSTGLRNYLNNFGSYKGALTGGKLVVYQGTVPTDPDAAISGSPLVTVSLNSGAYTAPIAPRWSLKMTVDGNLSVCTINGISIIGSTVAATGSITTTLDAIVAEINAYESPFRVNAIKYSTSTVLLEYVQQGIAGDFTVLNAYVLAVTTTGTIEHKEPSEAANNSRLGVTGVNGLKFGASSGGVISTSGVWSGTVGTSGTANYFVIYGNPNDDTGLADTSPYLFRRVIGTCGTTTASDYVMATTSLTSGRTHTIDSGSITLEEEV